MPDPVKQLLEEAAPTPHSILDLEALWARGRRQRRRTIMAGSAATALAIVAAVVVIPDLLSSPPRPDIAPVQRPVQEPTGTPDAGSAAPAVDAIADSPLAPRRNAHALWTGSEVLVVGGDTAAPTCPPWADCEARETSLALDGAAYDPATGTWRTIAPAPAPLDGPAVIAGDRAYFLLRATSVGNTLLSYDIATDSWEIHPFPAATGAPVWRDLVAAGDQVVAFAASHEGGGPGAAAVDAPDLRFDPATGAWTELPVDPLQPSFDRAMVWADGRLVLLALDLVEQPNSVEPALYRVASYDPATNTWTRGAESEVVAGDPAWFGIGSLVVNPGLGGADGGEVNGWGRTYPFGGIYDVASDTWEALPAAPDPDRGAPEPLGAWLPIGGATGTVLSGAWALDVESRTWTAFTSPDDGPDEGAAATWIGDDRLFLWSGAVWPDDGTAELRDGGWLLSTLNVWTSSGQL